MADFDIVSRRKLLKGTVATVLGSGSITVLAENQLKPNELEESRVPIWDGHIWDAHCHFSGFDGQTAVEKADSLIKHSTRMGVEKSILFMGWPFIQNPKPEEFIKQNNQVLDAIKHRPDKLLGYCYINPKFPQESLREMERCIKKGPMVGIKLWVAERCNHENLDPIFKLANQLKAVIYQHTWIKTTTTNPAESTPIDLVEQAKRHPKITFLCGHAGGNWELGIQAVRPFKNILIEIAGSSPTAGFVEMAVRELSAERIVFGSDCGGRSLASQIAKVAGANITDEEKATIFSGNIKRLLSPILKSKGKSV